MSDTPRTDAENWIRDMGFEKWVSIDFARELERELAAAKAELVRNADELAAAIKQRDEARDTAAAIHRRNWYEAKTEYGTALGKVRAELAAALRALQKAHDAMVLAQTSHNRVLTCDPPIDAWKHRCVDVHLGEAIRECAAAMRKGEA